MAPLYRRITELEEENKRLKEENKRFKAAYDGVMHFLDDSYGHGTRFLRMAMNDEKFEDDRSDRESAEG